MKPVVAVIAPGNMGAGVGARLNENGVQVLTSLAGRSAASAQRAAAAGMIAAGEAEIVTADFLLSIVPPKDALCLAQRLAPSLRAANRKPLYVDCNAVSPATAEKIAACVAETGTAFADAGIIGGPPRAGYAGPTFYVSGPDARRVEELNRYGLRIRVLAGGLCDASALKMSYGGLTKGLTALGAALALAAERAGVAQALHAELAESQPALLAYLGRSVPAMFPKAYRWVGELEEVARFVGPRAEHEIFEAIAGLYQRLADDVEGGREETRALSDFFARSSKPR